MSASSRLQPARPGSRGLKSAARLFALFLISGGELKAIPTVYPLFASRAIYFLAYVMILTTLPLTAFAGRPAGSLDLASRLRMGPGVSNHPVGVVPSRAVSIPRDWLLAANGTVTCTTCHSALPSLDGRGGPQLRGTAQTDLDSRAFCANCHRDESLRTSAALHWLAVPRAHIMPESDDVGSSASGSIDRASAGCLECHDGVTATDAAYETAWNHDGGYLGDKARNHPIGVRYPHAGTRHVEVPLRPAALLPGTIRLPDGMVSCLSCHDLYGSDPKRLTVPIEGSRLCMTCHQMD